MAAELYSPDVEGWVWVTWTPGFVEALAAEPAAFTTLAAGFGADPWPFPPSLAVACACVVGADVPPALSAGAVLADSPLPASDEPAFALRSPEPASDPWLATEPVPVAACTAVAFGTAVAAVSAVFVSCVLTESVAACAAAGFGMGLLVARLGLLSFVSFVSFVATCHAAVAVVPATAAAADPATETASVVAAAAAADPATENAAVVAAAAPDAELVAGAESFGSPLLVGLPRLSGEGPPLSTVAGSAAGNCVVVSVFAEGATEVALVVFPATSFPEIVEATIPALATFIGFAWFARVGCVLVVFGVADGMDGVVAFVVVVCCLAVDVVPASPAGASIAPLVLTAPMLARFVAPLDFDGAGATFAGTGAAIGAATTAATYAARLVLEVVSLDSFLFPAAVFVPEFRPSLAGVFCDAVRALPSALADVAAESPPESCAVRALPSALANVPAELPPGSCAARVFPLPFAVVAAESPPESCAVSACPAGLAPAAAAVAALPVDVAGFCPFAEACCNAS